jgi:hypothetical protein
VSNKHERATFSAVIARESGRSSIPETLMMESSRRGVLDRPVKPGDDVWRLFDNRIPGYAGPYNSRMSSSLRPSPFKSFFTALEATTSPSLA